MEITYIDRKTGLREKERIYGGWLLKFLYGGFLGSLWVHLFARIPLFSWFAGFLQKRASSVKRIAPFIAEYHIDPREFAQTSFASFNDFFIRKLKPECRPIDGDSKKLCMPADGRYLVFPDLSQVDGFFVKGQKFDLARFLCDPILARRYREGSLVLARLCPTDYHRFHFPCDGLPLEAKKVKGPLFSVSPIALKKRVSILFENKRMITEFETRQFGQILYVEVGATCVGTIEQTYEAGKPVKKGDEKGYFSFGGSCLALLFEKGRVRFDEDLIRNSAEKIETKGEFGTSLGVSTQ